MGIDLAAIEADKVKKAVEELNTELAESPARRVELCYHEGLTGMRLIDSKGQCWGEWFPGIGVIDKRGFRHNFFEGCETLEDALKGARECLDLHAIDCDEYHRFNSLVQHAEQVLLELNEDKELDGRYKALLGGIQAMCSVWVDGLSEQVGKFTK